MLPSPSNSATYPRFSRYQPQKSVSRRQPRCGKRLTATGVRHVTCPEYCQSRPGS